MTFTLPDLPYGYNSLEPFIDETTMQIHHDKHHGTYVDKLNAALEGKAEFDDKDIDQILKNINSITEEIKTAVKNNGGGHANHTLFWEIMAPPKELRPEGKVSDAINAIFGDFDTFKEKFTNVAVGRFGSGWAWLTANEGKLEIIDTPNQDSPLMDGKNPILGLDVWEHAYYLKYQNRRADYINAWWNVINWVKVEENFNKLIT